MAGVDVFWIDPLQDPLPDLPLVVETLQERLEEAVANGADPEVVADLQAQIDFFEDR